jgi:hypothetical protein
MPAVRLDPWQNIVGVHWADDGGAGDSLVNKIGIVSVSRDPTATVATPWHFAAYLHLTAPPAGQILRSLDAGGENIVGDGGAGVSFLYPHLIGPGFAPAVGGRSDPDNGETEAQARSLKLPEQNEIAGYYLWHCGTGSGAGGFETLIVNMGKLVTDFPQLAGVGVQLGGAQGNFFWRQDQYDGPGFFYFDNNLNKVLYTGTFEKKKTGFVDPILTASLFLSFSFEPDPTP